jgi:hypothetical protein
VVGVPLGRVEAWEADGDAVLAVVGNSLGEECRNTTVDGGFLIALVGLCLPVVGALGGSNSLRCRRVFALKGSGRSCACG